MPGRNLVTERHTLPLFNTMLNFNAYVEGWALYAEQLADEIGLYEKDPLGRLGYLQLQLFRACRLVADTGLHSKHWSREDDSMDDHNHRASGCGPQQRGRPLLRRPGAGHRLQGGSARMPGCARKHSRRCGTDSTCAISTTRWSRPVPCR